MAALSGALILAFIFQCRDQSDQRMIGRWLAEESSAMLEFQKSHQVDVVLFLEFPSGDSLNAADQRFNGPMGVKHVSLDHDVKVKFGIQRENGSPDSLDGLLRPQHEAERPWAKMILQRNASGKVQLLRFHRGKEIAHFRAEKTPPLSLWMVIGAAHVPVPPVTVKIISIGQDFRWVGEMRLTASYRWIRRGTFQAYLPLPELGLELLLFHGTVRGKTLSLSKTSFGINPERLKNVKTEE